MRLFDVEKVTSYLLNVTHPTGAGKAFFLLQFGFVPSEWQLLSNALKILVVKNEVIETIITKFGTKYIVDGVLQSPDDRNPKVRTVWFIKKNNLPKFVTAYPIKK